jgi:hypothetical protein
MTSKSPSGMSYPQSQPLLAGNPKDSAIAANNQAATKHADLIKATSGGSRHRRKSKKYRKKYNKYKYGGAVAVPQFQMPYTPTGAGGQTPNDIITQNSSTSTQNSENAKYDNLSKSGGSRKKHKKGGNNDWKWGCYSGGVYSRKLKNKKNKKRRTIRHK